MKKQVSIGVGEFYVSADPGDRLITVLGSCVAAILYDSKRHIGGMAHIILPGRRTLRRPGNRGAYYADTGIPLLLEAMLSKGARKEDMTAGIAGGGSILESQAVNSIGMQNTGAVQDLLKKENIPVKLKDVGGDLVYKVYLDIDDGNIVVTKREGPTVSGGKELDEGIDEPALQLVVKQIDEVIPGMEAGDRLLEAVHQDNYSVEALSEIISTNFVLGYHIFRLCNSPYYGIPGRIESLADAERLLGKRHLKLICVTAGTMKNRENPPQEHPAAAGLSLHSHATALIAGILAHRIAPAFREKAYTAGLLHCIGKFALYLLRGNSKKMDFSSSPLLANKILTRWHIPPDIIRIISRLDNPPVGNGDTEKLTAILHLACRISHFIGISFREITVAPEVRPSILSLAGLDRGLEPVLPSIMQVLESAGLVKRSVIEV